MSDWGAVTDRKMGDRQRSLDPPSRAPSSLRHDSGSRATIHEPSGVPFRSLAPYLPRPQRLHQALLLGFEGVGLLSQKLVCTIGRLESRKTCTQPHPAGHSPRRGDVCWLLYSMPSLCFVCFTVQCKGSGWTKAIRITPPSGRCSHEARLSDTSADRGEGRAFAVLRIAMLCAASLLHLACIVGQYHRGAHAASRFLSTC